MGLMLLAGGEMTTTFCKQLKKPLKTEQNGVIKSNIVLFSSLAVANVIFKYQRPFCGAKCNGQASSVLFFKQLKRTGIFCEQLKKPLYLLTCFPTGIDLDQDPQRFSSNICNCTIKMICNL